MDTLITFNTKQFPDLFSIIKDIQKYENGEIKHLSWNDLDTLTSEIKRVQRGCEEVEAVLA